LTIQTLCRLGEFLSAQFLMMMMMMMMTTMMMLMTNRFRASKNLFL